MKPVLLMLVFALALPALADSPAPATAPAAKPAAVTPGKPDAPTQADIDALRAQVADLTAKLKNTLIALRVVQGERNAAQDQLADTVAGIQAPVPQPAPAPAKP